MTKFPDVFGTTQEYRNKVLKKGYIDIQKIRPKDVVDVEDDRQWLPDFSRFSRSLTLRERKAITILSY